jgi:uncharacterized membrane protein YgcG
VSRCRTLLLALPVAALVVAGCGGGDAGDSTESAPVATTPTTTVLTKAELIEQGDAICAEVNAAVGTVDASGSESGNPATQVADLYSGMVQSLRALGTPQEAAGYAEFSEAAEELARAEDEVKLAAERGDEAGLTSAESSAASALESFKAAAGEYGFEKCTEGPSAPSAAAGTPSEIAPEEAESGVEAEPEAAPEEAPEATPETGGAGGTVEGGGTGGGTEGGGGTSGGGSGGIGPG